MALFLILTIFIFNRPYRQGKSYFLSKLIGDTANGFKVGHTDESCTKGIYMWSEPIDVKTPNGIRKLILLDTEVNITCIVCRGKKPN